MRTKLFLLCFGILLLVGCNKKKNEYESISTIEAQEIQEHPGKKLMKVHCYVCHDAVTSEDKRVAPPMIAIKRRYMMVEVESKEEFITNIQNFVKNPTLENAIMYGAIKKFGVMSRMVYPESIIEKIADYMYDNELEKPEWFEAHYNKHRSANIKND